MSDPNTPESGAPGSFPAPPSYEAPPAQPTPTYEVPGTQAAPNYGYQSGQPGADYGQQYGQQYAQPQYQQPVPVREPGFGSAEKLYWKAALMAIFLGTWGVHKFYLGYKTEGIIMLVIGTVGILCAGLGPLVMLIISWIEAATYLGHNQEDFNAKYVVGKKAWF
ncbi:MAG: TM2 domain-containing protein [Coriobacteriales bacterium]|nr:TM2 domain-containing protein [Coriobacteriales bacterium]